MTDQYKCALCTCMLTRNITDEVAMRETRQYWPDMDQEECDIICDDCWQKVRPENVIASIATEKIRLRPEVDRDGFQEMVGKLIDERVRKARYDGREE